MASDKIRSKSLNEKLKEENKNNQESSLSKIRK